jgi:hypothetical protein
MAEADDYTVFEIVNAPLKEIYVGATRRAIHELAGRLHHEPHEPIRHWDLREAAPVRSIEFDLNESDAHAFIRNYVKTELPKGWRFLHVAR